MSPFISIIMAVYNNERYFPIAVKSIMDQTFTDWELVIVDDGSTDKTPQIADSFAAADSRIKVIHQENQWIFRSYNNGIAAASGKYVFIVNSDDTINPESLQRIHDVAVKDDADMVMFNLQMYLCDEDQNITEKFSNESNDIKEDFSYNDIEDIHSNWCRFLTKKWIGHQCVYKTELAQKLPYGTNYYAGDIFYNIHIADQLKAVAGTSCDVYNHFTYDGKDLNASVGKYYGYEHQMFNEYFLEYKELFQRWGQWNESSINAMATIRFRKLTVELQSYMAPSCKLTIDEKLEKIMTEMSDGIVYGCAAESGRIEEYQSRILSALRALFCKEIPSEGSRYYFLYELLDRLLSYEKDEEDMETIRRAVYDPLNPQNIGECFYKKLIGEKSELYV